MWLRRFQGKKVFCLTSFHPFHHSLTRMERCHSSQMSTLSSSSGSDNLQDTCRICHSEEMLNSPLISPCYCSGSLQYVHQSCLQQWIINSHTRSCELCTFHFIMHKKMKPFMEWEKVDMSPVEQRGVFFCFATVLLIITSVVGSSYVHVRVAAKRKQSIVLELWFILILYVMGYIAVIIVLSSNFNACTQVFRRWKNFNSVIYFQNAPPKIGIVQQQQMVVFSVAAQLNKNVLASEETKRLSLHKNEFHNCRCNNNSSSHNSSIDSANNDEAINISEKIAPVELDSAKTSLTSITNNGLIKACVNNHLLSEDVVISLTTDPVSSTSEQILCIPSTNS